MNNKVNGSSTNSLVLNNEQDVITNNADMSNMDNKVFMKFLTKIY